MKITILLSLISTAVVALSQPAWAGGWSGGAVVSTEEVSVVVSAAVALVRGGFRGGALAAQPIAGGAVSRGGGVGFGTPRFGRRISPAPYTYNGIHFATRSLGGTTGAFRYYNGGSRSVCCSDVPIQRSGKPTDEIVCREEHSRCSPANRPASPATQNMRTSNAHVGSPESDGQSPGVCAP